MMTDSGVIVTAIDFFAREAMLFAAIGFLLGGLDDLAVDLVYLARRAKSLIDPGLPPPPLDGGRGRIAVFIPAWDEAAVVGAMLRTALDRYDYPDYRLYVGTYPNDPDTIQTVAAVAWNDPRVRLVIGPKPGPTTKADCLNNLWRALLADETREGPARAVLLHDAEDVVHRDELKVHAAWLTRYDAVQVPVLALPDPRSPLVSGHYIDEFAEAHAKSMVVRQAVGAGMPFAGTGCAIDRGLIGRLADMRGGMPFDASSLTEDYELGLTLTAMGGRTALARVRDEQGRLIAVSAYFPSDVGAAVRQKARWMTGIALAGWDRVGWQPGGGIGEHWMRMRDRRATLAIPVLAIAYLALISWGLSLITHVAIQVPMPRLPEDMGWMLTVNGALLAWRLAMRAMFTWRDYGPLQAALSAPRMLVANYVALLAARRAVTLYWKSLRGGELKWDKTSHRFPVDVEVAG